MKGRPPNEKAACKPPKGIETTMETIIKSAGESISEIVTLHSEIVASARTTLDKAIRIGELLVREKKLLKHGEWLPFLAKLPFSDPTAQRYMRCYGRRAELKSVNVTDLSQAYRLLVTKPAAEKRAKVIELVAANGPVMAKSIKAEVEQETEEIEIPHIKSADEILSEQEPTMIFDPVEDLKNRYLELSTAQKILFGKWLIVELKKKRKK
jgi:Protein of unknown function (DUF3102)